MAYTIDPDKKTSHTKVFYEDKVFETLNWDTLPRDGVLFVVIYREDGSKRTMSGKDFYFQAKGLNDEIFGCTDDERSIQRYTGAVVLRGKWADDMTFTAVELEAKR